MATIDAFGSTLGTQLQELLNTDYIQPGSDTSYQLCKTIYLYHPLGKKMTEGPVAIAQSQKRVISIPGAPEDRVREQFMQEWDALNADNNIANTMSLSRVYGAAAIVVGAEGVNPASPMAFEDFVGKDIFFNVLDPLNTSGSLVLDQNPNSPNFLKTGKTLTVQNTTYHMSKACIMMHEQPIYINYQSAAFGYTGRSVYQRALYPLKSYVQSMRTNDLVQRKAGLLIAMVKGVGSIVDKAMQAAGAIKRNFLKEAQTGNVIQIDREDKIESIDMRNADTAMQQSRKNILEDCAAGGDMPAQMLNSETFAEGFGEGTEDAKTVVRYIDGLRKQMNPLYEWFERITMYRAWTEEFYKTIQKDFPEQYGNMPYATAFLSWVNSFHSEWTSLLIEPDSEKAKTEDVKLKAIVSVIQTLLPSLDPANKAILVQWAADNINMNKVMFPIALDLDAESLQDFLEEQAEQNREAMEGLNGGANGGAGDAEQPSPFSEAT